jgi:hypothetical protein
VERPERAAKSTLITKYINSTALSTQMFTTKIKTHPLNMTELKQRNRKLRTQLTQQAAQ